MTAFIILLFLVLFVGVVLYERYQHDVFVKSAKENNRKIMSVNNVVGDDNVLSFMRQ